MAVPGRMAFAAACLHRYGHKGSHIRALPRGSGISACSAAVKKRPHAVCADAFIMPCNQQARVVTQSHVDAADAIQWAEMLSAEY